TRRRRATGSSTSRTSCALSIFKSRLEATRSESRPGSSIWVAIATRSCEMFFPSDTIFSKDDLTLRMRASSSGESGTTWGSVFGATLAVIYGLESSEYSLVVVQDLDLL